jgi:hypothetical protein
VQPEQGTERSKLKPADQQLLKNWVVGIAAGVTTAVPTMQTNKRVTTQNL